jgi:hypothetical protein
LEVKIAHLAFRRGEGEIAEGDSGAYMIVAQRECVGAMADGIGIRLAHDPARISVSTLTA